jgi:hypothetical protein
MPSLRHVQIALAIALLVPESGARGRADTAARAQSPVAAPVAPGAANDPVALPAGPPLVPWEELRRHPALHLSQRVRLVVQLHGPIASWNPYLTRFGMRDYAAFRAWSDEQFPWRREDHESPALRFFVRRDAACARAFDGLATYARCELVVRLRELSAGEPWLEVESVRPLELQLSEGLVIHAGRAIEFLAAAQPALAETELERALAGSLPERARAELQALIETCRSERTKTRAPRTGPTKQP